MTYFNAQGQGRVGWRSLVVTQVVNAVDADAQAFITAAGITNLTQASAVNTLVNDLKTYGLWTKMKALYPMVGGTATSHKFNLKDPRDLDAAFRLVFYGGMTHTSLGMVSNYTTSYADTRLTPSTSLSSLFSQHVSVYSQTSDASPVNTTNSIGEWQDSTKAMLMKIRSLSNVFSWEVGNGGTSVSNTDAKGFYLGSVVANNSVKLYKNNTNVATNTATFSGSLPTQIQPIGKNENKTFSFASIGDGLTDTEAANFYNSVQKFQTTLGRQIGSPIVSDTDAQAFLNAAGITDLGQANAVNTLVVDLKAAGVWTKMKALYPFVGGTATTHKFNLKDPRDLDAAFRLAFSVTGWTHTAAGALSNGTSGYADPKMPANQIFTSTNGLMGVYTSSTSSNAGGYMYGVSNMANSEWSMYYTSGGNLGFGMFGTNTLSSASTLQGLSAIGMETNGYRSIYKNDSRLISSNNGFVAMTQNFNMFLAARNAGGGVDGFASLLYSFSFISSTLTLTEYSAFYTAVQKYQTTLGRQVGTPVLAEGQTAGLLETYSGAAAAYSLRKLRNGYVGNAIRVRRSSDNAEQDIAFNTSGGLDTVSLLAFVGGGNGFVTTWYDQSSNGYNMLQTTATAQPQIVSSGNMILENGKPTVSFTSNSKKLQTINLPLSFYDCSLSYVSRNISRTAYACGIFGYGNNAQYSGTRYLGTSFGANTLTFIYFGADVATNLSGAGDTKLALYSLNYQSNTVNIYKDNSTYNSSVSLSNTSTAKFAINDIADRGEMATINFSEGIFYTNGQSSNLSAIRSNQNSDYSIY